MSNRLLRIMGMLIFLSLPASGFAEIIFGSDKTQTSTPPSSYVKPPQVVSPDDFKNSVSQTHQQNQQAIKQAIIPTITLPRPAAKPAPVETPPAAATPMPTPEIKTPPSTGIAVPESLNTTAPVTPPPKPTPQEPVYTGFPTEAAPGNTKSSSGDDGWNVKY